MTRSEAAARLDAAAREATWIRNQIRYWLHTKPDSAELDRVLVQAHDLVLALQQDVQKYHAELGVHYDHDGYQTLIKDINFVLSEVNDIRPAGNYEKLLRHLPVDWRTPANNGGCTWFRGVKIDKAFVVLDPGHFDCKTTNSGNYYGVGTYFSPRLATAVKYGACVFGKDLSHLNVLRVKDLSKPPKPEDDVPVAPANNGFVGLCQVGTPGWLLIEAAWDTNTCLRIETAQQPFHELAIVAWERGFQALEYLESGEGHLMVVLIDLDVSWQDIILL
ncbi:hypothetical protein KBX06_10105 [Micromonospora sp. C31]|uniref:hypothetical protein n=1 Tax=Micromonospora sp. C31 TaxID=2824876 RepID=UPI001B36C224|nr:hypothetical protein [Micromonospora sp. C31]MBQ1073513.1 hypothetical protein [Micromonospora sp. C31]